MVQNELTKQLFAEGYTKEAYPEYIKEFNEFYGGFIYRPEYRDTMVYLTGCGIEVSGKEVIGTMMYLGHDWSYENFNPLLVCPYSRDECEMNHPLLRMRALNGLDFCACHPKRETGHDGIKLREIQNREEMQRRECLKEYKRNHAGHYCLNHMYFSRETGRWCLDYKPMKCEYCVATDACTLWGRALSPVKGNVYYDCRMEYASGDTIFQEETATIIYRAIPVLKAEISMTICEQIVMHCAEEIIREEFYHPYDMPALIRSVNFNVRAMSGIRQDTDQDLRDAQDGAQIIYHQEMTEKILRQKGKKQAELMGRRAKEAATFVLNNGFEHLKGYEKRHILKYLTEDRIEALLMKRRYSENGNQLLNPLDDEWE